MAVLATCTAFLMTSCGKAEEVTIPMKPFEIPTTGCEVFSFEIPEDWELTRQDGFCYWEFNDGENILQRNKVQVNVGEQDGDVYVASDSVARNFDDCTVQVSCEGDDVQLLRESFKDGKVAERHVKKDKGKSLQYLQDFEDLDMVMSENDLLVPVYYNKVMSMAFTACHAMTEDGFYTTWIMNYKFEDLQPMLDAMVSCNNGTVLDSYFQNDDVYYAKCGDIVVGAKKLTYNKWCCFTASAGTYENYLLKALYVVTDAG